MSNNPNQATTLDVDTFYKLCQKVITIRRREAGEQHRLRNTYWTAASEQIHQEHPGLNKAEVRAQVRARVLALVDRFTADILGSTEGDRARIMAAFRQWDEDTIKSALDPDWDRRAFFQRIGADNHLTEWASKITDTMQQNYICRKIGCQAVVENKHWLRKNHRSQPSRNNMDGTTVHIASTPTAHGFSSPTSSRRRRPS